MSTNNAPPADLVAVFDSHVVTPSSGALGTRFLSDVRARAYPLAPLTRQWELDAADIEGATDGAYVASIAGALTCTASLAGTTLTSNTATVSNIAPVNTTPAVITSSSTVIGSPVSVSAAGVWTGQPAPTITGVWLVNGVVDEANPSLPFDTNFLNVGDVVSYRETAVVEGETSASAASNAITVTVGVPTASGTIADITAEAGPLPIIFDAKAHFLIPGDAAFEQGVTWAITGTDASIDTEGNATILKTAARAESAYEITCTNAAGEDGQIFSVTVTASPITVPVLGTPVIGPRTVTYALNVPATVYWILSTTSVLTKAEIKAPGQTFAASAGTNTEGITIADEGLQYLHLLADRGGLESNISVAILDAQDPVVASVLSALTATPGSTTSTFTVTTDQAGPIYRLVSGNVSETAATIIASGTSQAVAAAGVVNLTAASGLTPETGYNVHVVQVNEQTLESNVLSAPFTTEAAMVGGIAVNSVALAYSSSGTTAAGYTVPAAITDPVGGVLVAFVGYRTSAIDTPAISGATLGGATLPLIVAPISYGNSKPWIAFGWLASPPAGALELDFGTGGIENRAMAISVMDLSGVGSWRAAEAFSDDSLLVTAAQCEDAFGTPSPAFADGDLAIGVIGLDGGDVALPSVVGGTGSLSTNTGGTASSDVTFGLGYDDVDGIINWTWAGGLSERAITVRLIADAAA